MNKSGCLLALLALSIKFSSGEYIPPGPKYKCPQLKYTWPCRCLSSSDDGLVLSCIDVSMAILSASLAYPTESNIPISHLEIDRLNSLKLYGSLFEGLKLQSLSIKNSPLETIYKDALFYVRNHLKKLEIINTQMEEYPDEALNTLNSLESLTLDQHLISNLDNKITGLNNLTELRISNGNISSFTKQTFEGLRKLKRLDLHGNALSDIPRDAFKYQRSVEFFDIAKNNMKKFSAVNFVHLTRLTWFNGSYNEITEFKRGTFARNSYLRVLHLTHNKIAKIDSSAFRGMRLLVRLYMNDNEISDIGRGTFGSIPRVRTIHLARNKIKKIDYQMFSKLPFAEELNVAENEISIIQGGSFLDLAYVNINVSHNLIEKIEKESFTNCINVTMLDMSHNKIDNFTEGAFDEVSYANEWRLEFNKLKSVKDIPIEFMAGIKILNVTYNELEEVPKKSFPKLYELHTIDFSHNNISSIGSAIFTNLFSLRSLNLRIPQCFCEQRLTLACLSKFFSYNNMSELRASTFGPIPTLLELKIDHNKLSRVSRAAFTRLVSLRDLYVMFNKLEKVPQIPGSLNLLNVSNNEISSLERAWPTMNALQKLDLSSNKLGGQLEGGSFSNLAALSQIMLADNNITEIPKDALQDLTTVQYLDLSYNKITSIPKRGFGRLPIVFDLYLQHNMISNISKDGFDGLLQLLSLDLSSNNITELNVGALSGMVSLQTINLSNNSLERTENGTNCIFEENLSLKKVDLSRNKMSQIRFLTFPQKRWVNYKLEEIDLSYNNIVMITKDLLIGTRTLKKLNLSHNEIRQIDSKVFLNITYLETLDLSYNKLTKLSADMIGPPENLTELNLEMNYLRKLPVEALQKAPFKKINLRKNQMRSFDENILEKIKEGSILNLEENPINCDCRLVGLRRYIDFLRPEVNNMTEEYYDNFKKWRCRNGELFVNLDESQLVCNYLEDPTAPKIPQKYDVEIVTLKKYSKSIELLWRVVSKSDIAGFRTSLLDTENNQLYSELFTYNTRKSIINLLKDSRLVCIEPRYSDLDLKPQAKQCQEVEYISFHTSNSAVLNYSSLAILSTLSLALISNHIYYH